MRGLGREASRAGPRELLQIWGGDEILLILVTNLLIGRGDICPQLWKAGNVLGMMQLVKCRP